MSAVYVLYVVLMLNPTGTPRPTSFTQEHFSKEACETAKESIRAKVSDARVALLTCEKK